MRLDIFQVNINSESKLLAGGDHRHGFENTREDA